VRVFERDVQTAFESAWNSAYYILVTMTTVGYGDIVAKTNDGRSMAMVACIVGVFLISMMIISVNKILTMSPTELNALLILDRVYSNKDLEESAKNVIYNFSKILRENQSLKSSIETETLTFRDLRSSLKEFNDAFQTNKSFGETTYNTIYNTISIVAHDQEDYCEHDQKYAKAMTKLKTDLEEVYGLMNAKNENKNKESGSIIS